MLAVAHVFEALDEEECRALIRTAPLGRLAFTEAALPTILPVHFHLRDEEVVIASLSGSKVSSARRGDIVAFEVDGYDTATREGWTANVVGPSRLITDHADVAALDLLDFAPWTRDQDRHYIAVQIGLLRGRRLTRRPASEP